jgi:Protein of unknown function (DUF3486)
MPIPSKASKLPPALREALATLWFEQRYSLDQILEHLGALARGERAMLPPELANAPAIPLEAVPGRTGMHDHFKGISKAAEKIRRSRMAAESLAKEFGDASDDKVARGNFAMLHTAVHDLFMAAAEAEGNEGGPPVTIDPKSVMMLASALQKTEAAKKTHLDLRAQIRREMQEDAVVAAETVGREKGLSADTVAAIRARILGVKVPD